MRVEDKEIKLEILKIAERLHNPERLDYQAFCHFIDDLYKFVNYDYQKSLESGLGSTIKISRNFYFPESMIKPLFRNF